jgi:diguanylate cyclase (GGDEF)-like protein
MIGTEAEQVERDLHNVDAGVGRDPLDRPRGAGHMTELSAEMAEVGLSSRAGWYASVLLYGAGGIVAMLAALLRPDIVPAGIGYLGVLSVVLAALSAVGARYLANNDWAAHMRLTAGLGIFLIGIFVAGDMRVAFAMMPLFVLITPTFLYGTRFALPYVTVVTPAIFLVVLLTPGAAPFAQAVITAGAMLMITISFIAAERRTRALARINRRMAFTDPLTEIANTRRLRETLSEALLSGEQFALFAVDLDNFKLVNDEYDHTTGDLVLKAVAAALEEEVGGGDLVARRGGDEFSILITHPEAVELDRLTERLASSINRARLASCPDISPTGSVAHVLSRPEDSISSVLQRADDALHLAKLEFHAAPSRDDGDESGEGQPVPFEREAALRSVSAAVSRAYDRTPTGAQNAPITKRLRRAMLGLDLPWSYIALTLLPIGVVYMLLSAIGAFAPLPTWIGIATGLGMAVLGVVSAQAARVHARTGPIGAVLLAAIALVSVTISQAGPAGVAMLDSYVVLALFGFYVMRPSRAVVILLICCGAFLGFAVAGDFPDAGVRSAVTISVTLVAAVIVVKVRSVTLGFVRANRELSEVDALTGVANLRALRLRVASAIDAAESEKSFGRPMLMTVDLDRFKLVNDSYSHTVGDQMLEAVARAIAECVRIDEMVARRGGDEFFVLFSSTTNEHLESVAPRVREAVAHARSRICPDLTPTASVGCVAWEPGQGTEDFLAAADSIMHDEKIDTRERDYQSTTTPN